MIKLNENTYNPEKLEKIPTRNGFGEELALLGASNENIVALSADLTESTRVHLFKEKFPERFFQVGVAEQNMIGIAAGLALEGKIAFAASYAVFSPGRSWDQVRVSVCYSNLNVKIIGGHAGLSVGPDGATHQALEDIAITRVLPNMKVIVPADYEQAKKATRAIALDASPTYLRLGRAGFPNFTLPDTEFELGKANVYKEGTDVTIIACGIMVHEALLAAKMLELKGISAEVINVHTIKPLDTQTIIKSAQKTKKVITVEEHQISGGLGGAVSECLSEHYPVPIKRLGVADSFGESAEPQELLEKFGLTKENIAIQAEELVGKRY